jgi:two-component sensor histidine kinase
MTLQRRVPTGPANLGEATSARSGTTRLLGRRKSGSASSSDADLRYRTLFECVSDGFALVQVVKDSAGHVTDYVVLEANPALLKMFGLSSSPVGKRRSELLPAAPPGWLKACDTAMRGQPLTFEFQARSGKWFEIHLSRITEDQLAHIVVDISDRKQTERRHAEMFDELNHRVKNNLAIVSAMLSMQARAATSLEVRESLTTAVARIQTIADVHASLYRTGRKDEVDFAAYLNDLCRRLRSSVLDEGRITLALEVEPASLPLDKAVALGVLVNELVTNAAKHAYPPPSGGPINVRLAHAPESLVLTVGDAGPGFPSEPRDSGLGMRLIRSLVQQLGATLRIEQDRGAALHVRLPHRTRSEIESGQNQLI